MSDQIADLLSQVHVLERKYGRFTQSPASAEQIATLREAVRGELGVDLPDGYARFLSISNGLDWNGSVFYGSPNHVVGAELAS